MAGCVYFIRQGIDGCIKIGWSIGDASERMVNLQTGNAEPLILMGSVAAESQLAEREWHARFDAHRRRGEWFWPHSDLLEAIEFATRAPPAPEPEPLTFQRQVAEKPIVMAVNRGHLLLACWLSSRNISTAELAEKAGIALSTLTPELLRETPMSETTAARIEAVTGLRATDLLGAPGSPFENQTWVAA